MKTKFVLPLFVGILGFLPLSYFVAQSPIAQSQVAPTKFETYILPDRYVNGSLPKFSIQYPAGWFIDEQWLVGGNYLNITNYPTPTGYQLAKVGDVKTEIYFQVGSFEQAWQGRPSWRGRVKVFRKGKLLIDGKEAIRIWEGGDGSEGYFESILTYVKLNSNKYFQIVSYSNKLTPTEIDTIQRMHWSFRILE